MPVEDQKKDAKSLKFHNPFIFLAPERMALNPEYPEFFNGLAAKALLV